MKKRLLILSLVIGATLTSCVDYLDVSENSGLTEAEIFTNYTNTKAYFATVYNGDKSEFSPKLYNLDILATFPAEIKCGTRGFTLDQTTDMFTASKSGGASNFIKGSFAQTANAYFTAFYNDASTNNFYPIFKGMFNVIRTCNTVLANIDRITDANDQKDIEDLRGQAIFVRAYAHFVVGRVWGPMPYIKDVMTTENWDRPRLPADQFYQAIADDFDAAKKVFESVGLMRRDEDGGLNDTNQSLPTGVAAMAFKSRVLLYRASPLNNPEDETQYWIAAADAAADAINTAKEYGYDLLPWAKYYLNFNGSAYTNEHLWAWKTVSPLKTKSTTSWLFGTTLGNALTQESGYTGEFPTQNAVDMYDTKWGEPLVTAEDRIAATNADHYDDQDPYANRDPRLAGNIFCNGASMTWAATLCLNEANGDKEPANTFNSYYTTNSSGDRTYSTFALGFGGKLGDSNTGYIQRKRSQDYHKGNKSTRPEMSEILFRMSELYLNYAEAAFEGYGKKTSSKSTKIDLTVLEALNVVRGRVSSELELKDTDPTVTSEAEWRERIQKERTVELDQEGSHRYYDIRRWKIAPEVLSATKYAMSIKKDSDGSFTYTRVPLEEAWQGVWQDYMYYWPFEKNDYFKYVVFDTSLNQYW